MHLMAEIWILSKGRWKVEEICKSAQVISCTLKWGDMDFFFSVVYASNGREDRTLLWRDLIEFKDRVGNAPWLLLVTLTSLLVRKKAPISMGLKRLQGQWKTSGIVWRT
ncbi:hypothetical protein V6N13_058683 [Hibiscus sabdariffa]